MAPNSQYLSPEDVNYFGTTRRRVNDTFNLGSAQNLYQRQTAQSAFGRTKNNLFTSFARMRDKLPGQYASRGLLNSGLYQKGIADFGQRKNQQIGEVTAQFGEQMAGLDLAERQLGQVRTSASMDVDEQEQSRIAAAASLLRAAR